MTGPDGGIAPPPPPKGAGVDEAIARAVADGAPDAPWLDHALVSELRRTQRRNTALLQTAPDAILVLDSRGSIILVNSAAETLLRSEIRDLLGSSLDELLDGEWAHQLRRLLTVGGDSRVLLRGAEWRARRRDGTTIPVEVSLSLTAVDGEPSYTVFLRDVSSRVIDRRRMEELVVELRAATDAAQEANRAKSDFLSRMSHELRTPLNAILGFAELVRLEAGDELDVESIDHIVRAGRHLLALVEDVLDISRIEAGGLRLDIVTDDPGRIVATAAEMVRTTPHGAQITLDQHHPVGDVRACFDERRLLQVMANLLTNAAKYAGPGARVEVSGERVGDHWCISVTDDGPGIPADMVDAAFEPFERLGAEGGTIEGTGVGLALCRQLVEAMGGNISIDSDSGTGARVTVALGIPVDDGDG